MADTLVPGDFRDLGGPLRVQATVGGEALTLELAVESVAPLPGHRLRAEPFSLVLRGPASPALPQAIYGLEHPRQGRIDVFLVPIAADAAGVRYEALFN